MEKSVSIDLTRIVLGLGGDIGTAGLGFPSSRCNDRSRRAIVGAKNAMNLQIHFSLALAAPLVPGLVHPSFTGELLVFSLRLTNCSICLSTIEKTEDHSDLLYFYQFRTFTLSQWAPSRFLTWRPSLRLSSSPISMAQSPSTTVSYRGLPMLQGFY